MDVENGKFIYPQSENKDFERMDGELTTYSSYQQNIDSRPVINIPLKAMSKFF